MGDQNDNPSPGLAVFRSLYPGENDDQFVGRVAMRCVEAADVAIHASRLSERIMRLEGRYAAVLVERDKMAEMAARTANNPSDVFVEIYASLLAGMASSELWSGNVGAGATSVHHRDDLANAAYEMAETAVRRLEKGTK